ncbi:MAG: site-specific integrase [Clostridiales bacterium]|jgi:integrase|nr:site-specific integrase [Clostridiales bacterium]
MAVKTNYEKNGIKYARVTATVGTRPDGTRIRKEFLGKNMREAEQKKKEYIDNLNKGLNIDFQNTTLGEFMHTWLFEVVKQYASYATFDRYEGVFRNYVINTELFNLKIYAIKSMTLQKYYNRIYDTGTSSSQIFNLNKLLKMFFNYCIKEGYIVINPCFRIAIPGRSKASERISDIEDREVDPFTPDEIEKIKAASCNYFNESGSCLNMILLLGLGTGLRKGELLGLSFRDVDLENKEIHVAKALKSVKIINADGSYKYALILETPKTKSSIRNVPLPSALIPTLKAYLARQKEKYLANKIPLTGASLIFTSSTCNYLDGKNIYHAWIRCLKRAGVRTRAFHNIRHTYATQLFEQGIELLTVSKLLGHSTIAITAGVYVHVMPKVKTEAAESINHLFKI